MNRCLGCGAILQDREPLTEGFVSDLNHKYCERCFKITNYNDYIISNKSNEHYIKKIEEINKTHDLVLLTMDFLNMFDINKLNISNPIILVLNKKDLIPRSINEDKFLDNITSNLNIKYKLFVSSKNNYNLDLLMNKIYEYKVSRDVYVVGLTNSGKSTLINKILKNYSDKKGDITTSNLPSTTLDYLRKEVNDDLCLIDTPGLLDYGNIIMKSSKEMIKKIVPKKEINPIIYQIKTDQSIIVEDFLRLFIPKDNVVTLYMSNNLDIKRVYKNNDKLTDLKQFDINILDNQDLVINGLGFIKFKKGCKIKLYKFENVNYYVRNSIV